MFPRWQSHLVALIYHSHRFGDISFLCRFSYYYFSLEKENCQKQFLLKFCLDMSVLFSFLSLAHLCDFSDNHSYNNTFCRVIMFFYVTVCPFKMFASSFYPFLSFASYTNSLAFTPSRHYFLFIHFFPFFLSFLHFNWLCSFQFCHIYLLFLSISFWHFHFSYPNSLYTSINIYICLLLLLCLSLSLSYIYNVCLFLTLFFPSLRKFVSRYIIKRSFFITQWNSVRSKRIASTFSFSFHSQHSLAQKINLQRNTYFEGSLN